MKSLGANFQAHLDEGTTTLAWCWRVTRADGVSFGFTDHDRTLAFDGTDFESESGLTASEVRSGSDLSVDAQDAEGVLTSDRITETDILDGRWDNAEVEVWRVNWTSTSQRVLMRRDDSGWRLVAGYVAGPSARSGAGGWRSSLRCGRSPMCSAKRSGEPSRRPAMRSSATRAVKSISRIPHSKAPVPSSICCATAPSRPRGSAVSPPAGSPSAPWTGRAVRTPGGAPRRCATTSATAWRS